MTEVMSPEILFSIDPTAEEPVSAKRPRPHQLSGLVTVQTRSHDHHNDIARKIHNPNLSDLDIDYLHSKGAFDYPPSSVLEKLMQAFTRHFNPLYSIFDIEELEKLYRQEKLPPILLHAICLIAATYCDQAVIEDIGYGSRRYTRQVFYEKAKLLFDLAHETEKLVLLQTTLMLSFWGPQNEVDCSPYSWICSAVNIASSLGIQRELSYTHISDVRHKGLLRRLWWTLVRRDAYYAALLGRPFQIKITQYTTKMLTLDDFDSISTIRTGIGSALFQIECAKLALVSRCVILLLCEAAGTSTGICVSDLQKMLEQWRTELHAAVDWQGSTGVPEIYSTGLKLMFYHHIILIHLNVPASDAYQTPLPDQIFNTTLSKAVETAAQAISSSAFSLLMHSMAVAMPHEVYPAFLIASRVLVQRIEQGHDLVAALGKSALENCNLLMDEVMECWDPTWNVARTVEVLPLKMRRNDTTETSHELNIRESWSESIVTRDALVIWTHGHRRKRRMWTRWKRALNTAVPPRV
jgi:hypothetical protein